MIVFALAEQLVLHSGSQCGRPIPSDLRGNGLDEFRGELKKQFGILRTRIAYGVDTEVIRSTEPLEELKDCRFVYGIVGRHDHGSLSVRFLVVLEQ